MSTIAIVNGVIHAPGQAPAHGTLLVEGDTIRAVGPPGDVTAPAGARVVDAAGMAVAPGLIDLHIHGLLGHDSMGPGLADVIRALPAYGVTAFTATTITLPHDEILAGLDAMAVVLRKPPRGARCVGIHLEGPFLSPEWAGMATRDWFEPLRWERFAEYQHAADGAIRLVTLAPECGDALRAIPRLLAGGVVPVVGHSNATYEQVVEAMRVGLCHATHTFNAMRPLHHRQPGVVGAVLALDEITAQVVADGVHVHPAVIKILLRAKGPERVVLVSDAAPLAGMPEGEYEWEHKIITVRDGSCRLADGTIAGAHALLDTGVRTLVERVGLSLTDALAPATSNPARVLGLRQGCLSPGCLADLVLLDEHNRPAVTFVGGVVVYDRDSRYL
ncbi:MAG: N-acetylglucosamine-6-phosphate deacetylase [Anaerolineales bacterium]|nr:N-acetylglucosamine-6-phosphate deacetylase [Anaerolineales bacterium]